MSNPKIYTTRIYFNSDEDEINNNYRKIFYKPPEVALEGIFIRKLCIPLGKFREKYRKITHFSHFYHEKWKLFITNI